MMRYFLIFLPLIVGCFRSPVFVKHTIRGDTSTVRYNTKSWKARIKKDYKIAILYEIENDTIYRNADYMRKDEEGFYYKIYIPEDAKLLCLKFENDSGSYDDNKGLGYIFLITDTNDVPVPGSNLAYAKKLLSKKLRKEAKKYIERELKLYPWNAEAYLYLEGKIEDRIQKVKSLKDSLHYKLYSLVLLYSELGELDSVQKFLIKYAKEFPSDKKLSSLFARCLLSIKNPGLRKAFADRIIEKIGDNPAEKFLIPQYVLIIGKYTMNAVPIDLCEKFIKKYPDAKGADEVYFLYLTEKVKRGRISKYRLLKFLDKYPDSYYSKVILKVLGKYKEGIKRFPDDASFYNLYAYRCAIDGHNLHEARRTIEKGIDLLDFNTYRKKYFSLPPEERFSMFYEAKASFYDTYAWIFFKQNAYAKADSLIDKTFSLLKIANKEPAEDILMHFIEIKKKNKKWKEVLDGLTKLYLKQPENETLKMKILEVYKKLGKSEKDFDKFLEEQFLSYFKNVLLNQKIKDFTAVDLQGNRIKLSDFKGKVCVLNFFSIWCGPCVEEIPELNKIVDEFKNEDVVFIAITSGDKEALEEFLRENEFKYRVCIADYSVFLDYKIYAIPQHFLIDREGKIQFRHVGMVKKDILEREIKFLLKYK